jgi:hypothetical protein
MPPRIFYYLLPIQAAAAFFWGPFHGGGSGFHSVLFSFGALSPIGVTIFFVYDKPIRVKLTVIPVITLISMMNIGIWIGVGFLSFSSRG